MRLVTFTENGSSRIGLLEDGGIVDLSQRQPGLPADMLALIEMGQEGLERVRAAAGSAPDYSLDAVTLESVIRRPPKIIGIGLNYRAHALESNMELPPVPMVFTKQSTSATGPYSPVYWSEQSTALDYEGELAMVIGKRCRRVPREKTQDVILGYCVANDVSVRDWQLRGTPPSFTMGKSWDSHCPLGPSIVVADDLDPHALRLRTWVNDELRQDARTDDLIFDCFALVEFLSTAFTLEPGDVILTGTPSGVGFAMNPPAPLSPGDVVTVEIEHLGQIRNQVVVEPAAAACFY